MLNTPAVAQPFQETDVAYRTYGYRPDTSAPYVFLEAREVACGQFSITRHTVHRDGTPAKKPAVIMGGKLFDANPYGDNFWAGAMHKFEETEGAKIKGSVLRGGDVQSAGEGHYLNYQPRRTDFVKGSFRDYSIPNTRLSNRDVAEIKRSQLVPA